MNLRDFILQAPVNCGAHPAFGAMAINTIYLEKMGAVHFTKDKFKSRREQAQLALPFIPAPGKEDLYNHYWDVLECVSLKHDKLKHGIDNSTEILNLEATMSPVEIKMANEAAAGWWE